MSSNASPNLSRASSISYSKPPKRVEIVIPLVSHRSSKPLRASAYPAHKAPQVKPDQMNKPQDPRDPSEDRSSDLDYSPSTDDSSVCRKPSRKRPRESPSPASSATSISLGSTWQESTKSRPVCKPKRITVLSKNVPKLRVVTEDAKGKARASDHSDADNLEGDFEESGCSRPSFSPTSEEHLEDVTVEGMLQVQSDNSVAAENRRIIQKLPETFLVPPGPRSGTISSRNTIPPSSPKYIRTGVAEAGPSTAPGTSEWYRAKALHGGRPDRGYLEERSPKRARRASVEKLVTFTANNDHLEPLSFRETSRRPLSRLGSVSASSELHSFPTIGASSIPSFDSGPRPESGATDKERRVSELEAACNDLSQTPRGASLSRVSPKSSDIEFLSRLGLKIALEKLSAKYRFGLELVEEAYSLEDGLADTELVLEEMQALVEKVLIGRATRIIEESQGHNYHE